MLHSNEVCISGMTENQCKAKDDTWRNSAECETNVLQNFNLIDKKLPIIDLFLNPEKATGQANLKESKKQVFWPCLDLNPGLKDLNHAVEKF